MTAHVARLYQRLLDLAAEQTLGRAADASLAHHSVPTRRLFLAILLMRPRMRLVLVTLGMAFAVCGLTVPVTQKLAIDRLVGGDQATLGHAAMLLVFGFGALALARIIEFSVRAMGLRESAIVERWLGRAVYQKALALDYAERSRFSTGETVALMASHINMVAFFLTDLFPSFFTSAIPILTAPLILWLYFDVPPTALYLIIAAALSSYVVYSRRVSRIFQVYKQRDDARLGQINEWLTNVKAIRILDWTAAFERRLGGANDDTAVARVSLVTWAQLMNAFSESLPLALNIAGIVTLVTLRDRPPSPGEVFGILWVMGVFLIVPMRVLPWVFVVSLDASASLKRIAEFLALPGEPDAPTVGENPADRFDHTAEDAIVVDGLTVELGGHTVLEDVSFRVRRGAFVAIVGDVGAGKTQLFHALLGEVAASYRCFTVLGCERDGLSRHELRAAFGLAPQNAFTIGATIEENVRLDYGRAREATLRSAVERSLKLVEFGPDLDALTAGLDTELGERGVNLSGGQRQRLGLARAHYLDRPILLLDDTLSALDAETERRVVDGLLLGEWREATRLLITHRMSVLPSVDQILFFERGRLVAAGTLAELERSARFRAFLSAVTKEEQA